MFHVKPAERLIDQTQQFDLEAVVKILKSHDNRIESVENEQGELKKQNDRVWMSIDEILKKLNTQEKAQERTDLKVDGVKTAVDEVKTQVTRNSAQQEIYMGEITNMNNWLREQHAGKNAAAATLEQSREETKRTRITGFWEWTKVITASAAIIIGAVTTLIGAVTAFIKVFL